VLSFQVANQKKPTRNADMKLKILGFLAVGLLAGPMVAQSANVIVGGREWRQPIDTLNATWDGTAASCDSTTGVCTGALAGWTWASNTDVQSLFERLIRPGTTQFPTPTSDYDEFSSLDIATAFSLPDHFQRTYAAFGVFEFVRGWSRTLAVPHVTGGPPAMAYSPYLQHYFGSEPSNACIIFNIVTQCPDRGVLSEQRDTGSTIGGGVWLYRLAPPAPLLELLHSAVIGIGPGRSLADKVAIMQAYFAVPDIQSTCLTLDAFKNEVRAQRGKKIATALADQLTEDASAIMVVIPCP
jgi:hypothetical protein